jgi:hypothetical protein
MECIQCRSYSHKHKCGGRFDAVRAWLPYPVEECAVCNPPHQQGKFSEGPSQDLAPVKKPKAPKEPSMPKSKTAAVEKRATRRQMVDRKRKRKILIILTISHGIELAGDIRRVLVSFGVTVTSRSRTINEDLDVLCVERWIVREKVEYKRTKKSQHLSAFQWRYFVNTGVTDKIDEVKNGESL